jgi:hypothetical protein
LAEASKRAVRTLEDEAVRRAREGVKRVLFWQGKPLLMFLLKAYDRDKFGDQANIDISKITKFEDIPRSLLKLVLWS